MLLNRAKAAESSLGKHGDLQKLLAHRKLRRSSSVVKGVMAALLAVCLLCIMIRFTAGEVQQQQLPASNPNACLRAAFTSGLKDRSVYSQVGEDGILETIFSCIGARSKYYVEFGTEDGTQCSTRLLREQKGWTGLLLDGGYKIPELNLNQEMITAEDIVQVFEKYAVPKPLLVRKQQLQGTVQQMDPQEQQRQELLHQEFLRQQQLLSQQASGSQVAGQPQNIGLQQQQQQQQQAQLLGQQASGSQVAGQHQNLGQQQQQQQQQQKQQEQLLGQQASGDQVAGQQQNVGLRQQNAGQQQQQQQQQQQEPLHGQQQGQALGLQTVAQGTPAVTHTNVQEMLQQSTEQEQQMRAQLQQTQGLGTGEQQSGTQQQQQQQLQHLQQQEQLLQQEQQQKQQLQQQQHQHQQQQQLVQQQEQQKERTSGSDVEAGTGGLGTGEQQAGLPQQQLQQQQQQQQQAGSGADNTDLEDRMIGRRRLMQLVDEEDEVEVGGEQQQPPMTEEQRRQQQQEEAAQVHEQQLRLQEQHLSAMGQSQGHMRLDQLTVDIDMNTFWVLREILQAGYRPRSLTAEFNRNLGPNLPFAAIYMPKENWQIDDVSEDNSERSMRATCYFGASAVALNRLTGYYGYVPIAVDEKGVNIFYVHNSTVGGVPVFTWEEVVANVDAGIRAKAKEQSDSSLSGTGSYDTWSDPSIWNPLLLNTTWSALHGNCHDSVWLEVNKDVDFGHGDRFWGHGHPNHFARQMRPILLRHEPIEGTTRRRFYQPRGVPRLGWVDAPEGVQEEQYWAPEHPEQPSVQLRLQLKAQQDAQAMASAGSQWQTDASGWAGNGDEDGAVDGFDGGRDEEAVEEEGMEDEDEDLDEYGDEGTVDTAVENPPPFVPRRRQGLRRRARGTRSRYSKSSFDDGDYGADYFGDSSFDDEGEGYGAFGGWRGRRRGRRGGRRRRGFSPVANMRGVLSSLHLAAAFLFGIMASLLVSMLARRNKPAKVGTLPTYRVKS